MKNTLAKYFHISLAIVALVMIAAGQNSLNAQNKEGDTTSFESANRIVGAWEGTVTMRNCETGEPLGPAFPSLATYNEGGTVAEYGANPATPFRTPGHGIWIRNGGGDNYSLRFSFIPLTPAGVAIGRLRVSQEVELSRFSDEINTSGSFVLTNFSGVVLATGCTTSTAVRLRF